MGRQYKTFDDLEFESWLRKRYNLFNTRDFISLLDQYKNAKQAILYFPNGYGISVLVGTAFYSNGTNTYEVAVLQGDKIVSPFEGQDSVFPYQTKDEVTDIMRRVQCL